jgi:hypothetical protein
MSVFPIPDERGIPLLPSIECKPGNVKQPSSVAFPASVFHRRPMITKTNRHATHRLDGMPVAVSRNLIGLRSI